MPICRKCGREIEFRYVNGKRTPMHDSGGCCNGAGAYDSNHSSDNSLDDLYQQYSVKNDIFISNHSDENFCRPTHCPKCGDQVFFIRHNGGSVWVDELGWPWPKHACFNNTTSGDTSLRVLRSNAKSLSVKPILGLVNRVKVKEGSPIISVLGVNSRDGKGKCLLIEGKGKILIGQIVALDLKNNKLKSPYSIDYTILSYEVSPEEIGLHDQWLSDCWYNNKTLNIKEINSLIKCHECNAMIRSNRLSKHMEHAHNIRLKN